MHHGLSEFSHCSSRIVWQLVDSHLCGHSEAASRQAQEAHDLCPEYDAFPKAEVLSVCFQVLQNLHALTCWFAQGTSWKSACVMVGQIIQNLQITSTPLFR